MRVTLKAGEASDLIWRAYNYDPNMMPLDLMRFTKECDEDPEGLVLLATEEE